VSVTQSCYIKTSTVDAKAAMKKFEAVWQSVSNRPAENGQENAAAQVVSVN
jgi:hypothetical protein